MRIGFSTVAVLAATACGGAATGPIAPDLPLEADSAAVAAAGAAEAPRSAAAAIEGRMSAAGGTPVRVVLAPGHYWLAPRTWTDPACGNCEDPARTVDVTAGLVVSGHEVVIEGTGRGPGDVVIHTGAGYGIVFDGCEACVLRGLTVTGGARDTMGEATSAAVLVRDGSVRVERVHVRDNIGDSTVVARTIAGIIGVAVREGGDLTLTDSRITRNSWDGVAMYRDARATIRDNVIDGVDKAAGGAVGGGRGVGIGLTWNARATVEGNLVRRYWKGIGVFVDAEAGIRENVVEDVLTWGIVLWDADKGTPRARIERNLVARTGACGVNIHDTGDADPEPGRLADNLIVETGQNSRYDTGEPYCEQTAIARPAVPDGFEIAGNLATDNREPGDAPGREDLAPAEFERRAAPLLAALSERRATAEADVLRGEPSTE